MYKYIYICSSNLWESNHRDSRMGHKNVTRYTDTKETYTNTCTCTC